ncbi:MAG: T9SS type A sorting domain-containing protein, partial [Bacteroidales bacterium]
GDADQCPDDPDKTEPGLCGCGVPEGTCETSALIVNSGSGDGDYYPYESVSIVADGAAEGEVFDSWVIVSGDPLIAETEDPETVLVLQGSPAEITATYAGIPLVNEASFVSQFIPPLTPGEDATVQLTMRNTGTTSWTKARGYGLGSQYPPDNKTWGLALVDMAASDSILPGEEKTFYFEITAPATDDAYDFQWQMMQADSGWFGETSFHQIIRLTSSSAYLDDCDQSTAWKTSGTLQMNSTDKMQGSNCLEYTGGGTDEFKKIFSSPYNTRGSEAGSMLQFWYFVSDVSKLQGSNQVELGSAGKPDTDEYNWRLEGLTNGWNYIRLPISEAGKLGNPDLSEINWFRLYSFKSATITTKIDAIQLISDGIYTEVNLTVNNGAGSGAYEPGDRVLIQADAAASGEVFDAWLIQSGTVQMDNPNAATTYLTMPDTDAEVAASYVADPGVAVPLDPQDQSFRIYPVPVHETLHLEFRLQEPSVVSVVIRDLSGRVLIHHPQLSGLVTGENHYILDIAELSTGSYFVELQMNQTGFTRMIVVI